MSGYWTLQEVADQFGRSTRWVREYLINTHRVEVRKLNRKNIFISKVSLERYLQLTTKHAFGQLHVK